MFQVLLYINDLNPSLIPNLKALISNKFFQVLITLEFIYISCHGFTHYNYSRILIYNDQFESRKTGGYHERATYS